MGKIKKTYFDFADDDQLYLMEDYRNGRIADYMGSLSQDICERYLKHIVDICVTVTDTAETMQKHEVLRTYNLKRLIKYLIQTTNCDFSKEERSVISSIDGFYFTTRYPGDDAEALDKEDIENCVRAIQICREKAIALTISQEIEQDEEPSR